MIKIKTWLKKQWLALFVSCLAIITVTLIGEQWYWSPVLGVVNQLVWIYYAVKEKQLGLLPSIIAFLLIYIRMWWVWWS
jgi:hypothetical protein